MTFEAVFAACLWCCSVYMCLGMALELGEKGVGKWRELRLLQLNCHGII